MKRMLLSSRKFSRRLEFASDPPLQFKLYPAEVTIRPGPTGVVPANSSALTGSLSVKTVLRARQHGRATTFALMIAFVLMLTNCKIPGTPENFFIEWGITS